MRKPAERSPVAAATGLGCEDVADVLPGVIDASASLSAQQQAHIDACLRCQAELARYRRLVRVLHSLCGELTEPSPGLLAATLDDLEAEEGGRYSLLARRAAYLGGIVATAAASAAGVLVWATRRRDLAS